MQFWHSVNRSLAVTFHGAVYDSTNETQFENFATGYYKASEQVGSDSWKRKVLIDIDPSHTVISGKPYHGSIQILAFEDKTYLDWDGKKTDYIKCLFAIALVPSSSAYNLFEIHVEKKTIKPIKVNGKYKIAFKGISDKTKMIDITKRVDSSGVPFSYLSTTFDKTWAKDKLIDKWLWSRRQVLEKKLKPIEGFWVHYSGEVVTLYAKEEKKP